MRRLTDAPDARVVWLCVWARRRPTFGPFGGPRARARPLMGRQCQVASARLKCRRPGEKSGRARANWARRRAEWQPPRRELSGGRLIDSSAAPASSCASCAPAARRSAALRADSRCATSPRYANICRPPAARDNGAPHIGARPESIGAAYRSAASGRARVCATSINLAAGGRGGGGPICSAATVCY